MKCEEALHFLSQMRKTLPGIENFLQNTLIKEHLSARGRNELNSILHILSHIQLTALPSQGNSSKSTTSSSSHLSSLEHTHSVSTYFATDTDSFESSPFSSPTRITAMNTGRGKRSEIKTESNRVLDSNTDKQIQPIAVSRSGRQLKVATQRVTTQFHMESVGTRKRRPRVNYSMSPPPTKRSKTNKQNTHKRSKTNKQNTHKRKTTLNTNNNKGKQLVKTPNQKSLIEWTHTRKANKKLTSLEKHTSLPDGNTSNQINN